MTTLRSELRVEIDRLGNKYVALTRQSDGREILSNTFQHNLSSPHSLQPQWLVETADDGRSSGIRPRPTLAQAAKDGRRLYRYLFGNGKALRRYLAHTPDGAAHYVTLAISAEAAALWRLPWEYLHDGDTFPCLAGRMLISRRPADLRTLTPQVTAQHLHILAVIANPEDRIGFDADEELNILHTALEHLIGPGRVHLDILPEPTSSALLEAVRARPYEVIHFVGHGIYPLDQHQGYLCFENEIGRSELLDGAQLPRFLEGWSPRLMVLSTPQKAQTGVFDAFAGVANALLRHDLPSVLALPASLPTITATGFFKAFYTALARGNTIIESLQLGRQGLREAEAELSGEQQRCQWGLPTLYQRTPPDLPVTAPPSESAGEVGPDTPADTVDTVPAWESATTRVPLIGRKHELQAMRKEIKAGATTFVLWGSDGIGKRALMAYFLSSLGARAEATLVIRCRELPDPLTAIFLIAEFWRGAASAVGYRAAEMLLDPREDPFERAKAAQTLRSKKRYRIYFEGIDAWFDQQAPTPGTIGDETLREILLGCLSAPGNTLFFFTSNRRWADIARLDTAHRRDIPISLLPLEPSIRVMNHLPHLQALSLERKREIHWQLGGHAAAFRLLDGLLELHDDGGHAEGLLAQLLASPTVEERSTRAWLHDLLHRILDGLDPGEQEALRALAPLRQPFQDTVIPALTPVASPHAAALIRKWRRLGLIEKVNHDGTRSSAAATAEPHGRYLMQATLQQELLASLSDDEARALHRRAADYYGAPMMDEARRRVLVRNLAAWSEERVMWLARDTNGVLGMWLRQPGDTEATYRLLNRALVWHHHLRAAGNIDAAEHIARTLAPELNRQGQHDLARRLLHQTSVSSEAPTIDDAPLPARPAPSADGIRHHEATIQALHVMLKRSRAEGHMAGEADTLMRLAAAYQGAGNPREALVHSQAAVERYEGLSYPYGLAAAQHQQGGILRELGQLEGAAERFAASLRLYKQLDDRPKIADSLIEIGLTFEQLGKIETAIQVIQEAINHYAYLRNPEHSRVLALLEQLYARQKRLAAARARVRATRAQGEPQEHL